MAVYCSQNIVTTNLQIYYDWSNLVCSPGGASSSTTGNFKTFYNLVDAQRNLGYMKNSVSFFTTGTGFRWLQPNGAQSGTVNNVGDRIDINTSAAGIDRFGAHSFSIMFWVNQAASGKIMSTGSAGTGTGDSDQCIWQMWCDTGQFFWWNSTGGATNAISAIGTWHTPGTWQLIGFTYSYNEGGNDIVRCYTNGVEQFSATIATATHSFIDRSNETIMQYTLGGGYNSSCFNVNQTAAFGAFMLYNAKLSSDQMLQNYNATYSRYVGR